MSHLNGKRRARYVRALFGRAAERYDIMNRLISFGQDRRWRREAVRQLRPRAGELVLDLGAGTGELAREILDAESEATVIAADFTTEMIAQGRKRSSGNGPLWVIADALRLPFADESFDALISGFLLRNLADLDRSLAEQVRVLRPGGRWVSLETTPPAGPFAPLVKLHFALVIPTLGGLLAGEREAYQYLPTSTEAFLPAEDLATRLRRAGLRAVGFSRRMLGSIALHWGHKR